MNLNKLNQLRNRRKNRVRFKVRDLNRSNSKRVCFFISNKHMYAQLIDETSGKTLTTVSTLDSSLRKKNKSMANKTHAESLGSLFYEKASKVLSDAKEPLIFDRGARIFHGKIKAFADTLREKGMNF